MSEKPQASVPGAHAEKMQAIEVEENVAPEQEAAAAERIIENMGVPPAEERRRPRFNRQAEDDGEPKLRKVGRSSERIRPEEIEGADETPRESFHEPDRAELEAIAAATGVDIKIPDAEEPEEEPEPEAPAELTVEQLFPDDLAAQLLAVNPQQILDPARPFVDQRRQTREERTAAEERDQYKALLDVAVEHIRQRAANPVPAPQPVAPPPAPAEPQEPEEELDLWADGPKFVERLVAKALAPISTKLEQAEERAKKAEERVALFEVESKVAIAESAYEKANPGYHDRVAALQRGVRAQFEAAAGGDTGLVESWVNQFNLGTAVEAQRAGKDPFAHMDSKAKAFIAANPGAAPAVAPVPSPATARKPSPRRDGSIAAAAAAMASPTAANIGNGGSEARGGPLTPAAAMAAGRVTAEQFREILNSPRGIDALVEFVTPFENGPAAARGWG